MIWKDEDDQDEDNRNKGPMHIPAPKVALPGHAESYNPPEEYLPTAEEIKEWEAMDPEERPLDFIPKKFKTLRHVGAYNQYVKERFNRCLDLYLCPRSFKRRLNIDPESLIPKLPKAKDLKPFPNTLALAFDGHEEGTRIACLSVSDDGQYLISGGQDGKLKLWEVETTRCLKTWNNIGAEDQPITCIEWNTNPSYQLVAIAAGKNVYIIPTHTGGSEATEITKTLIQTGNEKRRKNNNTKSVNNNNNDNMNTNDEEFTSSTNKKLQSKKEGVQWEYKIDDENRPHLGDRIVLQFENECTSLKWHHKG